MAKVALLIGISQYEFDLNALSAPDKDAKAMQQVLENKEVCDFTEVKLLINPHHQEMAEAIELLFRERKKDDLVLLYFSGHGLKDEAGNLYLTNSQTKSPGGTLLTATAISAHFIQDLMNKSRSRRQVVILDCCFSGAFGQGLSPKDDGSINIKNQLGGEGRAILTSSGCIQYSYEQKGSDLSIYTNHFIEG
ncbi:MAG TPA: caspase family protein, partial [Coleofasciculaceae cyanobacterium]